MGKRGRGGRGVAGDGHRQRVTADRARLATLESEGFIPYGAWRDATARVAAMEHATLVKIAAGEPLIRITRRFTPRWAR